MASVFKRKYTKVVDGKRVKKQSKKYYTRLTDADGIKRTIPLFRDKTASQQRAAQLQKEIELARAGVIDRFKEHRKRPLAEHLEDFKQSLLAKCNTEKHANQTVYRIKRIFQGCKFANWNDIQPSKVQSYLAGLRSAKDSISAKTFNYYLKASKQFCKWMVQDRRAGESPLEHLQTVKSTDDERRQRRALEPDEVRRLLDAAKATPQRFGMTGYQRAILYRLAVETGLRASELHSLKVSSFDFTECTVTVEAAYSKNRKQSQLPLRQDTVVELQGCLAGKLPTAKAFNLPDKTAKMLRADLVNAGIDYIDDSGRIVDFHSLRHTCGSFLAASGVHPKVAQSIMRHRDINLTMSRYTHVLRGQESEAVANLPDLSLPSSKRQKAVATGTDGRAVDVIQNTRKELTPKSTPTAFSGFNQSATVGNQQSNIKENGNDGNCLDNSKLDIERDDLSLAVIGKKETRPAGLEPATFGFEVLSCLHNSLLRKGL